MSSMLLLFLLLLMLLKCHWKTEQKPFNTELYVTCIHLKMDLPLFIVLDSASVVSVRDRLSGWPLDIELTSSWLELSSNRSCFIWRFRRFSSSKLLPMGLALDGRLVELSSSVKCKQIELIFWRSSPSKTKCYKNLTHHLLIVLVY